MTREEIARRLDLHQLNVHREHARIGVALKVLAAQGRWNRFKWAVGFVLTGELGALQVDDTGVKV